MKTIYRIIIAIIGWLVVGLSWYLSSLFFTGEENRAIGVWLFLTDVIVLFCEVFLVGYFLNN